MKLKYSNISAQKKSDFNLKTRCIRYSSSDYIILVLKLFRFSDFQIFRSYLSYYKQHIQNDIYSKQFYCP